MLIDVKFSSWDEVKKVLTSDPETVLFDISNFDRLLIVKTVNTYEWNDCLYALETNLDALIGGCWVNALYYTKYLADLTSHHENKGN